MAKQEKNTKISSRVGLENLTNDAIVANSNGNNSSSVSKNKPKKTFVKPESILGLTVGNLKKFDSSNPILAGAEFGFNALPKTTSTMAYYNLNGIAESLLKIDIEGAEYEVLKDCSSELFRVKKIFIEYHSWNNSEQRLSEILAILEENKFRYYIEDIGKRKHPFIENGKDLKMDLQLNIFGYKDDS